MKQLLFFALISLHINFLAQENTGNLILNSKGLTADSLIAVTSSPNVPLTDKYQILKEATKLNACVGLEPYFANVLNEARQQGNDSIQIYLCNLLLVINVIDQNFYKAGQYVETVLSFENRVTDNRLLFAIYDCAAKYYAQIDDDKKMHYYYYKAIEYGEKIEGLEEKIIMISYNLFSSYEERNETKTMYNIIERLEKGQKDKTPFGSFFINSMKGYYYSNKYENILTDKNYSDELLLDSIAMFSYKAMNIFDTFPNKEFYPHLNQLMGGNYRNLAEAESSRKNPKWKKVLEWIDKSEDLAFLGTVNDIKNLLMKVNAYNNLHDYTRAITESNKAFEILDEMRKDSTQLIKYNIYANHFYDQLSYSFELKGDINKALEYRKTQLEYLNKMMLDKVYESLKDMEVRYDLKTKQQEIKFLNEYNLYQKKMKSLYAGISILLIIIVIVVVRLYLMKRNATIKNMEMIQMEKHEVELQVKLKEEQAKRIQLEKYEALLEVHFKDLAIEGKEAELEELKNNKKILDKQLKTYSEKLRQYEERIGEKYEKNKKNTDLLIEELKSLLERKGGENKDIYLDKLNTLNENFITQLEEITFNNISPIYIKYCMCIAINMTNSEIAECFSVELNTVHMVRYRIKKKLKLSNNDDLDIYLSNLMNKNM
ncbi:hypothetical protein [Prevotella sp. 10(H)]|uniref:hypothetical protein n=1 Tax=Prevotella sp. 10(H) TaxID=1158294 RepID=UPI0004A75882|nr:hypothetical protein [Prevotella sp. 10(H)]